MEAVASAKPEFDRDIIEKAVDLIFESIAAALAAGDRVELRGFGTFQVRERGARAGRNPKSGDRVEVPPKRIPFFTAGKELRERVDHATAAAPTSSRPA